MFYLETLKKNFLQNFQKWISAWAFFYFVLKILANLSLMSLIKKSLIKWKKCITTAHPQRKLGRNGQRRNSFLHVKPKVVNPCVSKHKKRFETFRAVSYLVIWWTVTWQASLLFAKDLPFLLGSLWR